MIISLVGAIVMLVFLFIDQITKAWAYAAAISQKNFFLGIIRFHFLEGGNDGIAFGLFGSNPTAMKLVTAFTVVMVVAIAVLFYTVFKRNKPAQIALAVIEAGAIGNLIDRFALGTVRDFIDVSPLHFGVCNVADFCVTFGAVALVFIILFIGKSALFPLKKKWREEAKAEQRAAEEEELKRKAPTAESAQLQVDPENAQPQAPKEGAPTQTERTGETEGSDHGQA